MSDAENNEFDEEMKKLDKKEEKSFQKLNRMFKKMAQDTRTKVLITRMLTNMARATRYSIEAEKIYWDRKEGKPKTDADYDKAEKILNDGIKLIDQAILDFPSTAGSFLSIKDKMLVQLKDIEFQRKGINKPIEEIQKKVGQNTQKPKKT